MKNIWANVLSILLLLSEWWSGTTENKGDLNKIDTNLEHIQWDKLSHHYLDLKSTNKINKKAMLPTCICSVCGAKVYLSCEIVYFSPFLCLRFHLSPEIAERIGKWSAKCISRNVKLTAPRCGCAFVSYVISFSIWTSWR